MARRLGWAVFALGAVLGIQSAAAQSIVLLARGPSAERLRAGAVLAPGQVLQLKAGDHLEFLDESGTHSVDGPSAVVAGHADSQTRTNLLRTFVRAPVSRSTLAAVRSLDGDPGAGASDDFYHPSLLALSTSTAGPACFVAGQPMSVWRGQADGPLQLIARRVSTGEVVKINWAANAHIADWPEPAPIADGEQYRLGDGAQASTVVWRKLSGPPARIDLLATELLDRGCLEQLGRLRDAWQANGSP